MNTPRPSARASLLAVARDTCWWLLRRSLAGPWPWVLLGGLVLLDRLLRRYLDLGIATREGDLERLQLEAAFLALLVVTGLIASGLARIEFELCRLTAPARLAVEGFSLLLLPTLTVVLALAITRASTTPSSLAASALAASLSAAHLAGLSLTLLRTPLPGSAIPGALILLAWWIPSLVPEGPEWTRLAPTLLDASAPLDQRLRGPSNDLQPGSLGAISALWLSALLLTRDTPQRNPSYRGTRLGDRSGEG